MTAVDIAQVANGWAAVFTSGIAFVAGLLAFLQLRSNQRVAREASAYEIFRDYMKLAFDNPKYSKPDWAAIVIDPESVEKYSWYVGCLLWACDEVLQSTTMTPAWESTVRGHLRSHRLFLSSAQFRSEDFKHHGAALQALIEEICAEPTPQLGDNVTLIHGVKQGDVNLGGATA